MINTLKLKLIQKKSWEPRDWTRTRWIFTGTLFLVNICNCFPVKHMFLILQAFIVVTLRVKLSCGQDLVSLILFSYDSPAMWKVRGSHSLRSSWFPCPGSLHCSLVNLPSAVVCFLTGEVPWAQFLLQMWS